MCATAQSLLTPKVLLDWTANRPARFADLRIFAFNVHLTIILAAAVTTVARRAHIHPTPLPLLGPPAFSFLALLAFLFSCTLCSAVGAPPQSHFAVPPVPFVSTPSLRAQWLAPSSSLSLSPPPHPSLCEKGTFDWRRAPCSFLLCQLNSLPAAPSSFSPLFCACLFCTLAEPPTASFPLLLPLAPARAHSLYFFSFFPTSREKATQDHKNNTTTFSLHLSISFITCLFFFHRVSTTHTHTRTHTLSIPPSLPQKDHPKDHPSSGEIFIVFVDFSLIFSSSTRGRPTHR